MKPKLYQPRKPGKRVVAIRMNENTRHQMQALTDRYASLLDGEVSQSIVVGRAIQLLDVYLSQQLGNLPADTVKEQERIAILTCLW